MSDSCDADSEPYDSFIFLKMIMIVFPSDGSAHCLHLQISLFHMAVLNTKLKLKHKDTPFHM